MTDNLILWNKLAKTDPKHTKPFNRSGGFKGTAIKPIWIIRQLTEQFGPCGIGWGMEKPQHEYVHVGDGEVLVFCTVCAWHGSKDNVLWGVGGDKAVTRRNDGKLFVDDEAAKKAFTDALNNAFKFVGVGGDIHMGMFEDDKYVTETRAEFEDAARKAEPLPADVERMIGEIQKCETIGALNEWKAANAKAARASGYGGLIVGEWDTRKAGLEAVANYRAG